MNPKGINQYRAWTAEEVQYLRDNYSKIATIAISRHIGRTPKQVRCKAYRLALRRGKPRSRFIFRPPEIQAAFEYCRKHYAHLSNRTLSVLCNQPISVIENWACNQKWHKSKQYKKECYDFQQQQAKSKQQEYKARYRERKREEINAREKERRKRKREEHKLL